MRRRLLRFVAFAALAVVGLLVAGLLVLHSNPVQHRVLQWSVGQLERRFDLDLVADDLHYNLAARRVTMTNVRLAAVGHRDDPFFAADAVTVTLPWAAYAGRLRFDNVDIQGGRVTITRDAAGESNLPPGRGERDPDAPPRRIDIRGVDLDGLNFVYDDEARNLEIRAPGIRADLAWQGDSARGPFSIGAETLVRVGDRRVTIAPVDGTLGFDGSNVTLGGMRLDTSEGDFVLNGDVARALDRPMLDLAFEGTTDLARSSKWVDSPVPVAGTATVDARMTGAPSRFVLDTHVTAPSADVGRARGVSIDAEARLTPDTLVVEESTIRPDTGGTIRATVDLTFGDDAPWRIEAEYADLDAVTAFRLGDVEPLPFGAALSGTAVLARETPGEPFRLEVRNTSVPRPAPGRAPLDGTVAFFVERERWRASQTHRMGATRAAGDIGGAWNRDRVTASTFDGTLDVATTDVGEAARFAELFGLDLPDVVTRAEGPLTADVTMAGTFTEPRFIGTAASDGMTLPALGPVAFTAAFDASERELSATSIQAQLDGTRVTGEVTAAFETDRLAGQLDVRSPDAAALLSALPEPLRLRGPLNATLTFGGTTDEPNIATQVAGSGLTLADQPVESLRADARIVNGGIRVERLTLRQPDGGLLTGGGVYRWEDDTFTANVQGQDLRWQGELGRMGDAVARMNLTFEGSGPIARPAGEAVVEFALSGGVAGELVDRGLVTVRLNGETALVTAHVPALRALVTARVLPQAPFTYDAVVVMHRIPLEPLLALAGAEGDDVTGLASLSATASGELSDPIDSRVFINLQDITASASNVPIELESPARLDWDGAALTVDTLDLAVGQGRLRASGRLGPDGVESARWQSTYNGDIGNLLTIGKAFGVPPEIAVHGPASIAWQSAGGLERSTATARLDGGQASWNDLPPVTDLTLDARFDGKTLTVSTLTGRWQDGAIDGAASLPRAVVDGSANGTPVPLEQAGFARLRVSGLTEAAFAPWLGPATTAAIDGTVSALLDLRVTQPSIDGIAGTLVLDEAAFTVAGVPVEQARPSTLALDGGVLEARDVAISAGGSPLTITGTARLTPVDRQALDLEVRGTADLQILSAFAPAVATDGDATIDVGIGGTFAAPVFNGRIDVAGAEVAIREPRIVVADLNGTIALDGQRVVFDAFNGTANGGPLLLDGGFLLEGFRPAQGGLTIVVERAALEYPEGLQSESNAIVTLRPGPTGWSLVGDITVERSAYTETVSVAGLLATRGTRAPTAAGGGETWQDDLRLNLWVTTLANLVVDNNYGRFEANAALRVVGTAAEPVLAGRVSLLEGGEVYLAGNTFYIERGSISFTNPFRIVPEFDMELRTLVSGTDITLSIDGPPDRLRTDVRSSDPTVDSREAIALLFGGLQGEDAITLLSTELLGVTGRAIGLDTLRVERGYNLDEFRADPGLVATETDPSTRLTISKRVHPAVELILSQSLRESGGLTAIVSYKPRRNIEVRAASRDNLDRSVALRHEITFGGRGTAPSGPAPGPEVASVDITGPIAPFEPELAALLELEEGEEFNFHQWQQDIDALRGFYHDRQHYEVRVRGLRTVSDDRRTVALEYAIEPGPQSVLVVDGHPLEDDLLDDIREAWRRTIFDRFLLEDIRARILRHLLRENVIGSRVDAEVTVSTSERKEIRVTVSPGTRVDTREIRFSGNRAFGDDRLRRVIDTAGVGLEAWLDPRLAAEAIDDFYREQGFLSARTSAGAPDTAGGTGVLPVAIDEGPRYLIGAVAFPGVSPERLADVAAAVRLDSGTPYVTSQIDAARDRIEALYAREGFNSLQLEIDVEPATDRPAVDVSFAILEGPRQILEEVSVTGATRTDQDVVQRALRLRIGEPVSLADWAQARKRLYDTNVFRQVDIEPVPMEPTTEQSAAGIQPMRAVVRVVEYPVWRLRYGAQLSDERAIVPDADGDTRLQTLGVLADLQNQNLFGRAVTAGIAGRYERDRQAGSLFTSNSSFFGLPIRSSGFVFTSRQRFDFDEDFSTIDQRVGVSAEQRWRPFRLSEVIWSYRYERSHTFDPDPAPGDFLPLDVVVNVSRLNVALFFDRRNDPTDPTRGWFNAANFEQTIKALGADYGNAKLLFQQSAYRGFGRAVLAGRAQFGSAFGDEALIRSERFLLGGATTVRGYAENSLGPRDLFGPEGGDALLNVNGEVRFPVRGWVQGVAFVDAGNVFATRGDVSLGDLFVGYGVGLRLASPYAMLRIDYGIPARTLTPDRPANQWTRGRWYFGVGHIF